MILSQVSYFGQITPTQPQNFIEINRIRYVPITKLRNGRNKSAQWLSQTNNDNNS